MKLKDYHDAMNSTSVIKSMAEILIDEEDVQEKKDMLIVIKTRAEMVANQLSNIENE